jgi:sugar phosphate isomerase/epimerase
VIIPRLAPVVAVAAVLFVGAIALQARPDPVPSQRTGVAQDGLVIGVQAWSFNKFTAMEAVTRTAQAGGQTIEFFPGQRLSSDQPDVRVGPGMSSEAIQKLRAHLDQHGVRAVAFGVAGIDRNEANARPLFEWARQMGIGIINTESADAIDTIEKMVKEYDIKVGFHNHPRNNDPNYKVWDPNYILSLVKNRDRRIGACADTGHWVRSGIKPVDALRILRGRVVSSHLKDLHEFSRGGHDVPYGTGVSDIPAILNELRQQRFNGSISVEYEYNWDNSLPDIAQCVGFVKGFEARNAPQRAQVRSVVQPVSWRSTRGWAPQGNVLSNSGSNPEHLFSTEEHGDATVHAEFRIPKGSNSGVYLQGRYEVQILDSSGKTKDQLTFADAGGIYQRWKDEKGYEGTAPLVNAFRGPGEWNTYDIKFRAPRFDTSGRKVENARIIEVRLNGIVVQRNVSVTGPTRAAFFENERPTGPLVLQGDHGPVEYRNVWIGKL